MLYLCPAYYHGVKYLYALLVKGSARTNISALIKA
jgi:hypothetical protein